MQKSAKKRERVGKSLKTKHGGGVGVRGARSWEDLPPPRVFFGSANSKGVTGESLVSAHSKRLKVAVFSAIWKWLVSADSKRVMGAFSILIGILLGSAHSKGVRRTKWRASMVRRARENRPDLTKAL